MYAINEAVLNLMVGHLILCSFNNGSSVMNSPSFVLWLSTIRRWPTARWTGPIGYHKTMVLLGRLMLYPIYSQYKPLVYLNSGVSPKFGGKGHSHYDGLEMGPRVVCWW